MASIGRDSNGRKRILFLDRDGKRQTVRLGKASEEQATACKAGIEGLQAAQLTGRLDKATAAWLSDVDDVVHQRLAAVGLVEPRESMTIGGWLESCLQGRKSTMKPKSLKKLADTKALLLAYFKANTPLRKITPHQASQWREAMKEGRLSVQTKKPSEAYVKVHSGNAKTFMREAVARKVIDEDPFAHLVSGNTQSAYKRYVTPEEIEAIISECPNSEWRLLFGLARYAGLRIPSESHLLTLADVDFDRGRMVVRSPKTERYQGHESRVVPIVPRLSTLLQARYNDMLPGESRLVRITGQGNMDRWIEKITCAASVPRWKRFWQTLRASCEMEWAKTFPQYVVSQWIGHSITVSGRHYANMVPDELFDRAASAAQNQAQQPGELQGNEVQADRHPQQNPHSEADGCGCLQEANGGGGNRTRVP